MYIYFLPDTCDKNPNVTLIQEYVIKELEIKKNYCTCAIDCLISDEPPLTVTVHLRMFCITPVIYDG